MARWTDLDRATFDTAADLGGLFDLTPAQVPADPSTGTADLLALIDSE